MSWEEAPLTYFNTLRAYQLLLFSQLFYQRLEGTLSATLELGLFLCVWLEVSRYLSYVSNRIKDSLFFFLFLRLVRFLSKSSEVVNNLNKSLLNKIELFVFFRSKHFQLVYRIKNINCLSLKLALFQNKLEQLFFPGTKVSLDYTKIEKKS